MKLNNGIVAYEVAHNKYMGWLSETDSQRGEWVTAYETIVELLELNCISCDIATAVCGREYQIIVYIDSEKFSFTFTY